MLLHYMSQLSKLISCQGEVVFGENLFNNFQIFIKMKKLFLVGFLIAVSLPAFSIDKGTQKDYYAVVRCLGTESIIIEGRCCEAGSINYCSYVSCGNYSSPTATCPSIGG